MESLDGGIEYYVNNVVQANGDHEVQRWYCPLLPYSVIRLGKFRSCREAFERDREHYYDVNGCVHRSPECHRQENKNDVR